MTGKTLSAHVVDLGMEFGLLPDPLSDARSSLNLNMKNDSSLQKAGGQEITGGVCSADN